VGWGGAYSNSLESQRAINEDAIGGSEDENKKQCHECHECKQRGKLHKK
jgi:hypothetical protein